MKTTHIVIGWFCVLALTAVAAPTVFRETSKVVESRAVITQNPNDPEAQKHHAELCLAEHLEAEALMAAQAAHSLMPQDAEANRLYLTALARNGKYQEALDAQGADASWVTRGDVKKIIESADLARKAEEKMQSAPETGKREDFQEIVQLLEKAVALDPANLAIRLTLGWVYLDKTYQPQEAYPHLEIVVKYHPDDVNGRKLFAQACSQTGRQRQAVEEFRQASTLVPDDLWVRANLGRALAKTRHYSEAETIYDEVLAKDPANVDARMGRAELAAWRGHSTEALEILNPLITENPKNVEALQLRADIHRWSWQLTEARLEYGEVLSVAKDDAGAQAGLEEAERMGSPDLSVKAYHFTDNAQFRRDSIGGGTRIPLTDKAYLQAHGAAWRYHHPDFGNLDRIDGMGGLEYHWSRWLETLIEGDVFAYDHRAAFGGAAGSVKDLPTPGADIYINAAYNQPFVSSISTVTNGLKQDSLGAGLDVQLGHRFSLQNSLQVARISDHNEWLEEKPQLSYRLFGPGTFIRAEYDFLTYKDFNPTYWTPFHRHVLSPVLDTTIPLGKHAHIDLEGKAPYIFDESKFGYQLQGGATVELAKWMELHGSYIYSSIPGDLGAWSGSGWEASLRFIF